jgi:uroporphyrinogen-III synthase
MSTPTLQEFLTTASQDHSEALAQAKAFSIGEGVLI